MATSMKANLLRACSKGSAHFIGQMGGYMRVVGRKVVCMEMAN